MIDIQWKGKIGYGDIVSPICYAHNVSYKLRTQVDLTFCWPNGPDRKIDPSDPETLWKRADFINQLCATNGTEVNVIHRFRTSMKENHTNYDWDIVGKDPFHNYWYPNKLNNQSSNVVVVNPTTHNIMSLKEYGKSWKDPVADRWPELIERLQDKYTVIAVDYRTPIRELLDILATARGFIGYHGTAAWPAKFMHVPSIIFSRGGKMTTNAFKYAEVLTGLEQCGNIEEHLNKSRIAINDSIEEYKLYRPNQQFIDHLHHDFT